MPTPRLIITDSAERLAKAAAERAARVGAASAAARGRFTLALSGGSTPRAMHRLLGQPPLSDRVPWHRTHVFWVDERMLPYAHPDSNYGNARTDFLASVPLPARQVHPMPVDGLPDAAAARYRDELAAHFGPAVPAFDLILLGMGADGHTASLFPGQQRADPEPAWVVAASGGEPPVDRLSLTETVINRSRNVVFLVSGSEKAGVVRAVITGSGDPDLPARRILPSEGRLTWMLDRAAAAQLPEEARHDTD